MSDELENENVESVDEAQETVETQEKKNGSKTFTQSDVDKVVQERVRREKAAFKKQQEALDAEKATLAEENAKYAEILGKTVAAQIEPYPDYVKSLLAKMSILEQVEWLSDEKNKLAAKKEFPQRKQSEGELEKKPVPQIRKFM